LLSSGSIRVEKLRNQISDEGAMSFSGKGRIVPGPCWSLPQI
jgi:hypothetical protein